MNSVFNNREIATGTWILFGFLLSLKSRDIRRSYANLIKCFFRFKALILIMVMAGYVAGCSVFLYRLELWGTFLLKDTIYWFLFSGFVLFMNLVTEGYRDIFFKKTFISCFKIIVLIQFLVNFYTFPLYIEFVFVPVLLFLILLSAFTENKPEYAPANKFFSAVQGIIGLILIGFVARSIYLQYTGLLKLEVLLSILLPIFLTILFLPFIYFVKLIFDYETLFNQLSNYVKNDKLIPYTKRKVLLLCHIDLRKLNHFLKEKMTSLWAIENKQDIDRVFKEFRSGVSFEVEE